MLYEKQHVQCCYRGERFHTSVGVHQGCLLSPTLFGIFRWDILTHTLDSNNGTISNGGLNITNHRFADGIDRIRVEKDDLTKFVQTKIRQLQSLAWIQSCQVELIEFIESFP